MTDITTTTPTGSAAERWSKVTAQLVASMDTPDDCSTSDVLFVIICLQYMYQSQRGLIASVPEIGRMLRLGESATRRTIKRLKKFGWLHVVSGKNRYSTSTYTINIDALPLDAALKQTVITKDAREMAHSIMTFVIKNSKAGRRFAKTVLNSYAFHIQWMIDQNNGDRARVGEIINFAFSSPVFRVKAMLGVSELHRSWRSLVKAYDATQRAAA